MTLLATTFKHIQARVQPTDLSFGPASVAWALATPLLHRLARGEGLLLAVNVSIILLAVRNPSSIVAHLFVSTVTLVLLYFLNDLHDCHGDLNDPHKEQVFVRFLVEHRRRMAILLAVLTGGLVAVTFGLVGAPAALAVAMVSLVNLTYSALFKGMAGLDVLLVTVWGASYAAVPGVALPWTIPALVGVMTGICHVFQIWRDRDVDRTNAVRTSAVVSSWLTVVELALLCSALGALLFVHLGLAAALTAAAPLALHFGLRSNQAAWLLSKLYYAVVWLVVLARLGATA
jgi:hypothetical protein